MSTDRYGYTTHQGPNIQLAHTVYGQPVGGAVLQNGEGSNIQPAGLLSTAPYKGAGSSDKKCTAKNGKCNGWRVRDSLYCAGHMRSFGLLEDDSNAPKNPKHAPE